MFIVLGVDTGIQLGIAAPLLPQSGNPKKASLSGVRIAQY